MSRRRTKVVIIASCYERAATSAQAGNFLKAMRGIFNWAGNLDYVDKNPCDCVKAPKLNNDLGFEAWTEEDVEKYEAQRVEGKKERTWLHVLLYTGLRRGDVVRLGRQNVHDGVATIRIEKVLSKRLSLSQYYQY